MRGVLLCTDAGLELAPKTDVRFTHIGSDEAVGDAGLLGETSGGTSRVRLLLEGTRPFAFGPTRQLTPSLQVQVGYGFSAFKGKGSMTPFAALSSSGPRGRELRAGALWARDPALQMSLAGTRREAAGERPAHGVEFRLTWRAGAREGYPGATGVGLGVAAPNPRNGE